MQDFESLKRSIDSTKDLESVVRTMKTLAAVSIRQYEQAVDSLADFSETVELGLKMVLWESQPVSSLQELQADGATGIIIFGSDQGMCGQFNEQIGTYAWEHFSNKASEKKQLSWMVVGSRLLGKLLDAGAHVDFDFSLPGSATGIAPLVIDILARIDQWRSEKRLGRIYISYNQRISASTYKPHALQLLPIDDGRFFRYQKRNWPSRTLPTFTMDRSILLSRLIRQYLFVSLFRACAESLAGENASRIASMQAAERNIKERLVNLQSEYNQQRQTSITEELLDVVTGFEALKDL
ncbi:MAG: F0F1 ATP synthase subunit gamma [Planctomycetes bacterium]|nr:F0F1 ATP synthase subunit gamma [Planctomycetota bacterium]MCH9727292.1 F0F1 ATP synthase subunit gamma [Planctomycetota bacterium]MCH9779150.1 F0F1 ATP synthase subunit gamma [Planctomycetota bacterium]MCH9792316.1 F0F1 ATP synthase subunit gamma [Planctomycetota bacterium]